MGLVFWTRSSKKVTQCVTIFNEQVDHGQLPPLAGDVQRGDAVLSGAARVGACRQERTRHACVSVMRRNVQRGEAGFRARVGVVLILRTGGRAY